MAVRRVLGKIDNVEVVLTYGTGDTWSVPVPFNVDGEYVVEIIAEDVGGNQSYLARLLYTVDASNVCVRPLPLPKYLFESRVDAYQFNREYPVCQGVAL